MTRISAHILGWNFKPFDGVNRKFLRFLLFFSIPRCAKGNQEILKNRARVSAYHVVQTLYKRDAAAYFRLSRIQSRAMLSLTPGTTKSCDWNACVRPLWKWDRVNNRITTQRKGFVLATMITESKTKLCFSFKLITLFSYVKYLVQ